MKKIYIAAMMSLALFTSCSMDEEQFGVINQEYAIMTVNDCNSYVNGLYGALRARTAGGYIAYSDLQMDQFQATIINGNRGGTFAMGSILPGTTEITSIYAGMYSGIQRCNFFLTRGADLLLQDEFTEEQKDAIRQKLAEVKFMRAYYNWYLFDHFCESYTETNAELPAKGIQIVTFYDPSSDRSTYPGRSTLKATVELINRDLEESYEGLAYAEQNGASISVTPGSYYINSYVVRALQARMALLTGDYKNAVKYAEDVINSGHYGLAAYNNYLNMWTQDNSTELIFVPFGDKQEGGVATGSIWLVDNTETNSDFVVSANVLAEYPARDVRYTSFITTYNLKVDGMPVVAPAFVKFPGNPTQLSATGSNNLQNKPKPFRLSELYLIAAEASDLDNDPTTANKYLNALRSARIRGYLSQQLSGTTLTDEIRKERSLELIGEGFRMSDLKRWGLGFTRNYSYSELAPEYSAVSDILYTTSRNLTYLPGDYRFVWPIPQDEMTVNPQLEGQQNPGYN